MLLGLTIMTETETTLGYSSIYPTKRRRYLELENNFAKRDFDCETLSRPIIRDQVWEPELQNKYFLHSRASREKFLLEIH
jgi:hypothetical protein